MGAKLDGVLTKMSALADSFERIGNTAAIDKAAKATERLQKAAVKKAPAPSPAPVQNPIAPVEDVSKLDTASNAVSEKATTAAESIAKVVEEIDPLVETANRLISSLDRAGGDLFNAPAEQLQDALSVGASAMQAVETFRQRLKDVGREGDDTYKALESAAHRYNQVLEAQASAKQRTPVAEPTMSGENMQHISRITEQYTMALGKLLDRMEAVTSRGGVIAPSSVDSARQMLENLKAIGDTYGEISGQRVRTEEFESALRNVQELSAKNKDVADLQRTLGSLTKSYDALITRISAVQEHDGVVRPSDIDRARQLDAKLKDIEARLADMGHPVEIVDRVGSIDKIEAASNQMREIKAAAKDVESAQKEIDKLTGRLETLRKAKDAAISNGRSTAGINTRIKQVNEQLKDATMRLDEANLKLKTLTANAQGVTVSFSRLVVLMERMSSGMSGAVRRAAEFVGKITGVSAAARVVHGAFSGLWRLLKYRLMRSFITDSLSDLNSCYVYLAKADAKFNALMNSIRTGWYNFKAAMASALTPLINAFGPSAVRIMDTLAAAIHRVGMALAALTGASTYTIMTAQVGDYSKSLDKANGSAKKLQNTLAGFDTFNLLDDTDSGSGSGSGSGSDVTYKKQEIQLDLSDGSIYKKLQLLGAEVKKLAGSIKKVLSDAWKDFASEMDFPTEPIDFLIEKFQQLNGWIELNSTSLSRILADIGKIAMDVVQILGIVLRDVIDFVAQLLGVDKASSTLEKLADILDIVHGWLSKNKELIAKIVEYGLTLWAVVSVFGAISKALQTVLGIGKLLGPVFSVVSKLPGIVSGVGAAFATVGSVASTVFAAIAAAGPLAIAAVIVAVAALGLAIWHAIDPEGFEAAFSSIGKMFGNLVEGFNTKLAQFGDWIVKNVSTPFWNAVDSVKKRFDSMVDGFNTKLAQFGTWVSSAIPGFFSKAWDGIKAGWNSLWSWFQGTGLYKFFSGIGDAVSSAFSKLGGGGSGSANTGSKVRLHASGGQINKGQLFIANERGPELIGKIGGKSTVANQNQAFDAVFKGIKEAFSDTRPADNGGDGDIYLEVSLDGDKVYNSVVKRNRQKTRQTGKNPLMA